MRYYTNMRTNEVFGYESIEDAEKFNDDFENLVEMSYEQFIEFRDGRPKGGEWSSKGWVVDNELLAKELEEVHKLEELRKKSKITELKSQMNMHILLGETGEAREVALEIRKLGG